MRIQKGMKVRWKGNDGIVVDPNCGPFAMVLFTRVMRRFQVLKHELEIEGEVV